MGRYNFTALRIRRRVQLLADATGDRSRTPWFDIVGKIPPAQVFVRKQPQQQSLIQQRVKTIPSPTSSSLTSTSSTSHDAETMTVTEIRAEPTRGRTRKSGIFRPMPIRYEEDTLRQQFYQDHPWELARPRIVLENGGHDQERLDWSTGIEQHQNGKKLDGESVIQRQLHLLHTVPDMTTAEAYDIARREFYSARHQEDIERRIAAEEARYTGAQFGPDAIHYGMTVEDRAHDEWEAWARQRTVEKEQKRAAFSGQTAASGDGSGTAEMADMLADGADTFLPTDGGVEEGDADRDVEANGAEVRGDRPARPRQISMSAQRTGGALFLNDRSGKDRRGPTVARS